MQEKPALWNRPTWLWTELVMLFGVVPVVLTLLQIPGILFGMLWVVAGLCLLYLWRVSDYDMKGLWRWRATRKILLRLLGRFALMAALFAGVMVWLVPPVSYETLVELAETRFAARAQGEPVPVREPYTWSPFFLLRWRPEFLLLICTLYPILSVWPQNIIYRVFFFDRYTRILGQGWVIVLIAAGAFGLGHLMFGNWVAPTVTALGGVLMADTYRRTREANASWLEHTLFGDFVWTLGIGLMFVYRPA